MAVDWNMVAALGQVASAIISLAGLGFIGWQIKESRKASDLQSLQTFLQSAADHESRLLLASSQDGKDKAFFEYLNFLEINASAVNGKLFPKVSRYMVVEKIREAVVIIEAYPEWHEKFQEAIVTPETFSQLQLFMNNEQKEISKLRLLRLNTVPPVHPDER